MIEKKFRAWDIVRKRMLYNEDLWDIPYNEIFIHTPDQRAVEVMQYTGLIDRNGKKVYEGDILSYKHITYSDCSKTKIEEIEDESFIEIITYAPMASIVKPHSKNVKCFGYDNVNKECLILDLTSDEVEVIGNKFENPELLG